MADVILKDRNGEDVTYEGVKAVTLQTEEGTNQIFHAIKNLNSYYVRPTGTTGFYYVIERIPLDFTRDNGRMAVMTNVYIEEAGKDVGDGKYNIGVLYTSKTLTVGETYSTDALFD